MYFSKSFPAPTFILFVTVTCFSDNKLFKLLFIVVSAFFNLLFNSLTASASTKNPSSVTRSISSKVTILFARIASSASALAFSSAIRAFFSASSAAMRSSRSVSSAVFLSPFSFPTFVKSCSTKVCWLSSSSSGNPIASEHFIFSLNEINDFPLFITLICSSFIPTAKKSPLGVNEITPLSTSHSVPLGLSMLL